MTKIKKSPASLRLLSVNITNTQRLIPLSLKSVEQMALYLLERSGFKEMGIHFVGKKKIGSLHSQFFDDPSTTDCITFPYQDPHFLGEVFVCPLVAQDYCKKNGGDLYEEITLYVVHGYCHLLGFDDQTAKEQAQMRIEEKKWMDALAKNHLGVRG